MPGGDRTGPAGLGPRTGRGLGFCSGYDTPGFIKGPGMGMGRGWGGGLGYGRGLAWRRGRGRGAWNYGYGPVAGVAPVYNPFVPVAQITPENQLTILKQEKEFLETEIKGITKSIEEISKKISKLEKNE